MEVLAKLGFLATNVVMFVVGVRLLWAWRRVRTAPELAIGITTTYSYMDLGGSIADSAQFLSTVLTIHWIPFGNRYDE